MISYFTPSHNISYLPRAYASLASQTDPDWEWIVLLNDVAVQGVVPGEILQDKRVHVHSTRSLPIIGLLKLEAALLSSPDSEIVAEFDHDDELLPECTARVKAAFHETGADFVYTDFVEVSDTGSAVPQYDAALGWDYRTEVINGNREWVCSGFEPGPGSFSWIWFGPNHLRAWRRSFYAAIGGHNPEMKILDDQDLFSRTYLYGKVHHLKSCLYIYHRTGENTCYGQVNAEIQTLTVSLHERYIIDLAARWSDLNGLAKIDLCCGRNLVRPGFIGVDSLPDGANTVCADLNKPWPFPDGSVGVIHAQDALEHLRDPILTMSEAWRVLAPGGWLITNTPSTDGRGAFQDPTHRSFWNSNSFWYYTRYDQARFINVPVRFQLAHVRNHFPTAWHKANNIAYVRAELVKPGPIRTPGRIEL